MPSHNPTDEYSAFNVSQFYEDLCGQPIGKSGQEIRYRCPRIDAKSHEVYVNTQGAWKCFKAGCASKTNCPIQEGGPRQFLTSIRPELSDVEAFKLLNRYGRKEPHPSIKQPPPQNAQPQEDILPDFSVDARAFHKALIELIQYGDFEPWEKFVRSRKPLTAKTLLAAGIGIDRSKTAVFTLPVADPVTKRIVDIRKRSLTGWKGSTEGGKAFFYGLGELPEKYERIIVVEGEWDYLTLKQIGLKEAILSIPGAGQFTVCLKRAPKGIFAGKHLFLCFDNDPAGKTGITNGLPAVTKLPEEEKPLTINIKYPLSLRSGDKDWRDWVNSLLENGKDTKAIISEWESIPVETPNIPMPKGKSAQIAEMPKNIKSEMKEPRKLPETVKTLDFTPIMDVKSASSSRFFAELPPPREFVIANFLPKLNVGVIAAPGGTGKGYLTIQMGLSVSSGLPFLGKFQISKPGGVLYINAEDDEQEIHRRFLACFHEMTRTLPKTRQKEAAGAVIERFYNPNITGRVRLKLFPDESGTTKKALIAFAKSIPDLRLIILDPANRLLAEDFNRVEVVTQFIQTLEEIATETNATALLATHTNKASQTGDRETKHASTAVLGSQAFVNAARWVMTLSTFDLSMVRKYKTEGPMEKYVSLRIPKANYLKPGLGELHLERVEIDEKELGGFGSGPLRLVDLTKKGKEITPEDVAQWVQENPGNQKKTAVEALRGKCGTPLHKTLEAIKEAVQLKLILEEFTGDKNHKVLTFSHF